MAYTPDAAFDDMGDVGEKAFLLYTFYCKHGSMTNNRVTVSIESGAKFCRVVYENACRLNAKLKKRGWIKTVHGETILIKGFEHLVKTDEIDSQKLTKTTVSKRRRKKSVINDSFDVTKTDENNSFDGTADENNSPENPKTDEIDSQKLTKTTVSPIPPYKENPSLNPEENSQDSIESFEGESASGALPAANAPESPPENKRGKKPKPPRDVRLDHPAIRMVIEIMAMYPLRDTWDRIIREIGDNPDKEFFKRCYEVWRSVKGNKMNLERWLFEPNETGQPPEIFGRSRPPDIARSGGNGKPSPANNGEIHPLDDEQSFRKAFEQLQEIANDFGSDAVSDYKKFYLPADWDRLRAELKKIGVEAEKVQE